MLAGYEMSLGYAMSRFSKHFYRTSVPFCKPHVLYPIVAIYVKLHLLKRHILPKLPQIFRYFSLLKDYCNRRVG